MEPNYVSFEATHRETAEYLSGDSPDMLYRVTIDGYPDPEVSDQGAVIVTLTLTVHGDIVVNWHHNGYRMTRAVLELINDIKKELADFYAGETTSDPNDDTTHRDSICPFCGGGIEYQGDQEIVDDSDTRVSWECPSCGATGKANYHGVFSGHSDIAPATFQALVYNEEDGTVKDEADYDDLEEAIAFAKKHKWDTVINKVTHQTLWAK